LDGSAAVHFYFLQWLQASDRVIDEQMSCTVVVGAQWGDEAKGKVVDYLAQEADVVVRYGGGTNAGHTIVVGDQVYKLHNIPSGILSPDKLSIVADGALVDPQMLSQEVASLEARGVDTRGLRVSTNAHVIMPYHKLLDELEEERRGKSQLGTTKRGIGPAYSDKAARIGILAQDYVDDELLAEGVRRNLLFKNPIITSVYGHEALDPDRIVAECKEFQVTLKGVLAETDHLIRKAVSEGRSILFEGAQGVMLDLDSGTYPHVTSSHPCAGAACIGTGIGPKEIERVVGVVKAYSTRVGAGPLPTELDDDVGERLREVGKEYGTLTGRPRRTGWLDIVALRHGIASGGITELVLTKLWVLGGLPEIKICTAYKIGDGQTAEFPRRRHDIEDSEPVYRTVGGWEEDIREIYEFDELPKPAQEYVRVVSELAQRPITMLSVGPRRDQTIIMP
jgi:adenylosuccinate synthase